MNEVVQEIKVIAARLPAASGHYRICGEERNGEKVWEGDFGKRLFSAKNGRWYIGNLDTIEKGSGWVRSAVHGGAPPYMVSGWEAFEKVGSPWKADPTIQVVLRNRSPSVTDSEYSGSLAWEAKLPQQQPAPCPTTPRASSKIVKPHAITATDVAALKQENTLLRSQLQQTASLKTELARQQKLRESLQLQVRQLSSQAPTATQEQLAEELHQANEHHRAEKAALQQQITELQDRTASEALLERDDTIARQTDELKQLTRNYTLLEQQSHNSSAMHVKLRRWALDVLQR
eukprot:TRINITY_DN19764_c0_g1_i1.p1 TRINITY_DN19764_c0_g1~~TRINITY_DN19764_c0_g1_i1.p1  ORF type:complete len:289 (+),score=60.15 TRINITY_DN19764_c0_g1_i1:51-917(+)